VVPRGEFQRAGGKKNEKKAGQKGTSVRKMIRKKGKVPGVVHPQKKHVTLLKLTKRVRSTRKSRQHLEAPERGSEGVQELLTRQMRLGKFPVCRD